MDSRDFPYSFTLERYEWGIVSLVFILFMLSALILKPLGLEITFTSSSDLLRYLIAPLIFVVAVHEGLHAGVARLLGGKVEFGLSVFGKINLAPYVAVRTPLRKGKWVYVITTPVLLSVVAYILVFALHSPWWGLVFLFNTSGMAGDLLILTLLLGMPEDALLVDEGTTMRSTHEFPELPRRVSTAIKILALILLLYLLLNFRITVEVER